MLLHTYCWMPVWTSHIYTSSSKQLFETQMCLLLSLIFFLSFFILPRYLPRITNIFWFLLVHRLKYIAISVIEPTCLPDFSSNHNTKILNHNTHTCVYILKNRTFQIKINFIPNQNHFNPKTKNKETNRYQGTDFVDSALSTTNCWFIYSKKKQQQQILHNSLLTRPSRSLISVRLRRISDGMLFL